MGKRRLLFIIFLVAISGYLPGQSKYDHLIFPDATQPIILVAAHEDLSGELLSGKKLPDDDVFAKKVFKELDHPFHRSVVRLNQCSRNFSGDSAGPNVLFLSNNEGGFPRQGLALTENDQTVEYPDLIYVDLVVRDEDFEHGAIDIYSHELGHVMMYNIWDNFPESVSPKQHVSMGITDFSKAFAEGWGIHFQRMAFDNIPLYQSAFYNVYGYDKVSKLWHSRVDESLRIQAVVDNRYIYNKLLPQNVNPDTLSAEEIILLEHTSNIYDFSSIKNAQQMLANEGVLATIFYHINTNERLKNAYQNKEFYNRFLLSPIPDEVSPEEVFSPLENVILKHFWVWHQIENMDFSKHQIMIEFIKTWCSSFPGDKEEMLSIFVALTVGKTVDNELAETYEQMTWFGSIGDYYKYKEYSEVYLQALDRLIDNILADMSILDKNIGPELWVRNDNVEVRKVLWSDKYKKPLYVNINTASQYEIASFWDMDLEKAQRFINKRNELSFFTSLEEAEKLGFQFGNNK